MEDLPLGNMALDKMIIICDVDGCLSEIELDNLTHQNIDEFLDSAGQLYSSHRRLAHPTVLNAQYRIIGKSI